MGSLHKRETSCSLMISTEVLTVCGAFDPVATKFQDLATRTRTPCPPATATPYIPRVHETSTTTWRCLGELDEFWRDGVPVHASQKLFGCHRRSRTSTVCGHALAKPKNILLLTIPWKPQHLLRTQRRSCQNCRLCWRHTRISYDWNPSVATGDFEHCARSVMERNQTRADSTLDFELASKCGRDVTVFQDREQPACCCAQAAQYSCRPQDLATYR